MTNMEPAKRPEGTRAWGTRAMRNPKANAVRYDPNAEDHRTGTAREEGQSQSPQSIDHGSLGGLGDDDHPQYLQKAGGQMTGVVKLSQVVGSTDPLTINNTTGMYVFTGTTATYTLPAVSGNTGVGFWIKNRGSGTITLNRAGSDNIYDTTTQTTISITAGQGAYIYNDGTYWLVMFKG